MPSAKLDQQVSDSERHQRALAATRRAMRVLESCDIILDRGNSSARVMRAMRKAQSEVEELEWALCESLGIEPG